MLFRSLVSKIYPCMSKFNNLNWKLRTAHYISYSPFDSLFTRILVANLEIILASRGDFLEALHLFDLNQYLSGLPW